VGTAGTVTVTAQGSGAAYAVPGAAGTAIAVPGVQESSTVSGVTSSAMTITQGIQ
jgi:hypothetical protein